jgi:hypothetical protein
MARGHHTSHHGKHHVSHAHHESAHVEHHHHKRGGHVEGDVDDDKGALDYTAESNVIPEAEGKRRAHGGRAKKAGGGAVHHGKHHVSHAHKEAAHVEHHHYRHGGAEMKHVDGEGHKSRMRHDRPGRKRGGGIGADMTPLTTAAKTTQAHAHSADNDELAR